MPRILDIGSSATTGLDLPGVPWLHHAIGPQLTAGAVYLVAGSPGIGKSTMTLQMLGALCNQGMKVLYLPTEQGLLDVKRAVERLFGPQPPQTLTSNLLVDCSANLGALPRFLLTHVIKHDSEYHGVRSIAVDSLQGAGLGTQPGEKFQALKEFVVMARKAGITCILVNHVTKGGLIAGPKTLEHEVDCILYLRRASRLRALFVPKHRDHPSVENPVMLAMTERGLDLSPQAAVQTTTALGYCGKGEVFADVQATVSIPRYGSTPALNAAFLPGKRILQLIKTAGSLSGIDEEDFSYNVTCYVPGQRVYAPILDLSIVTAILGSYLHQPVPDTALFVGEVDLTKKIRPPDEKQLQNLAGALGKSMPGQVKKVYVAKEAADGLRKMRAGIGGPMVGVIADVRGMQDLDELGRELWPEMLGGGEREERSEIEMHTPAERTCHAGAEDTAS
jgi:DNA repair protein RadA/Sms